MGRDDDIRREAENRHNRHIDHPTHRPLSDNYELVGLRSEEALANMFGGSVDLVARPNGDGGVDQYINLLIDGVVRIFAVDVKGARKPLNLICEQGKVVPDTIYILAKYHDDGDYAELLAWEWGYTIIKAPVKDFGYGVINHYIPREKCRSLDELRARQF